MTPRLEHVDVPGWPTAEDRWPVAVRVADHPGPVVPLYVHGVPTLADDWLAFLERSGGVAPDLPGFGRSSKRGDGDFTLEGYSRLIGPLLDAMGIERVALCVHDWGAAALAWAQEHPERVARLVVMSAVPLLPGYRWHRLARLWRTPGVGELAMGLNTRPVARLVLRQANATPGSLPPEFLDRLLDHFDPGTQRAILRLYRAAPEEHLAEAGRGLGRLGGVPALVVWGDRDPYLPAAFAHAYADALGGAEVEVLDDAGHWPWLDRPDLVDRVAAFLAG